MGKYTLDYCFFIGGFRLKAGMTVIPLKGPRETFQVSGIQSTGLRLKAGMTVIPLKGPRESFQVFGIQSTGLRLKAAEK